MRIIITLASLISGFYIDMCMSAPARTSKDLLVFPGRPDPSYNMLPYQTRGPFDFIGNWIQSSDWFPVEVNVPDTISNIGNGVGSFATNVGNFAQNVGTGFQTFTQNVGNGFQTFSQNVGNGFQNFAQNLSQRFPVLAVFVQPNAPPRYFMLVPTQNIRNNVNQHNENKHNENKNLMFNPFNSDILDSFP